MGRFDVQFNDVWGSELQIYAVRCPAIPAPSERITEHEIPGRDGKIYVKSGTYEPTEITIEFNYIGKAEEWGKRWREAKKWLSAHDTNLKITDDDQFYYKISRVKLATNERVSSKIGKFSAVFITKDGLMYHENGKKKKKLSEIENNPGITSKPSFYITGEGECALNVNGKKVTINVENNIVIDTERMLAYQENGTLKNVSLSGNYEDLYLQPGENIISITDGFECCVTPNWRCL